jgi:hypothetical protein
VIRHSPRPLIDELEASVLEASDAELIAESRGPWIKGRTAAETRAVIDAALRAAPAPRNPLTPESELLMPWRSGPSRDRD